MGSLNPSTAEEEEEEKSTAMAADQLPTDIISNIRRWLPIVDYLRFPAVCTAWRSAIRDRQALPHLPRGAPWIFIESRGNTAIYAIDCLTDASAPKSYRLPLPDHLHGHELISSTGNSLILARPGYLSGISLFNPFSPSAHLPGLPPFATLMPPPTTSRISLQRHRFFHRIHSVAADADSGVAVALLDRGACRLAYSRLHRDAGGSWINLNRLIPGRRRCTSAVVYSHGVFCVVDRTGSKVFALDLSSAPAARLSDMTFDLPDNYSAAYVEVDWCCYQSASLVSSGSSLFLVRWRNILRKDGVKKRREIDVYRLDDDDGGNKWVPVMSLGDHSFFIGHNNQSISMSTADFPDLKSNRVYLALDATTRIAGNEYMCPYDDNDRDELGCHLVYDLGDESWGVFYDTDFQDYPPHSSLWMIPRAA